MYNVCADVCKECMPVCDKNGSLLDMLHLSLLKGLPPTIQAWAPGVSAPAEKKGPTLKAQIAFDLLFKKICMGTYKTQVSSCVCQANSDHPCFCEIGLGLQEICFTFSFEVHVRSLVKAIEPFGILS